jgi:hypothetical protein
MDKLLKFIAILIEALSWLTIFLSPFLVFLFVGIYFYLSSKTTLAFFCALAGIILGIIISEKVRKTIGCSAFLGKLMSGGGL